MVRDYDPPSPAGVRFSGKGWDLMGIFAGNAALTAVTFGIYSFWAKVRTRKYLYNNTHLLGSSFEYHATGEERFRGFLRASGYLIFGAAIFVGMYFGLVAAIPAFGGDPQTAQEVAYAIVQVTLVAFFAALSTLLAVGRRRYHLSRTSWRNVRFAFRGSTKEYTKLVFRSMTLAILSFGLLYPAMLWRLRKYNIEHTSFGSESFAFEGELRELYQIEFQTLLCWMILAATFFIHIAVFGVALVGYLVYRSWIAADRYNYYWSNTTYMGKPLRGTMTGFEHLVTSWASWTLIVLTLGAGFPFAYAMRQRLYLENTVVMEVPKLEDITASKGFRGSAIYEGMSEAGEAFDAVAELI